MLDLTLIHQLRRLAEDDCQVGDIQNAIKGHQIDQQLSRGGTLLSIQYLLASFSLSIREASDITAWRDAPNTTSVCPMNVITENRELWHGQELRDAEISNGKIVAEALEIATQQPFSELSRDGRRSNSRGSSSDQHAHFSYEFQQALRWTVFYRLNKALIWEYVGLQSGNIEWPSNDCPICQTLIQ